MQPPLTEAGYIGDDIESVVSKLSLQRTTMWIRRSRASSLSMRSIKSHASTTRLPGCLRGIGAAGHAEAVGGSRQWRFRSVRTAKTRWFRSQQSIREIFSLSAAARSRIWKRLSNSGCAKKTSIGFDAELKDRWDKEKDILSMVKVEDLRTFGMIPEFLGRLPVICTLEGLNRDMLVRIFERAEKMRF